MYRIMEHAIPPIPDSMAPPALQAFLHRAMAKDPAQRPQSAREFEAELRDVLAQGARITGPHHDPAPAGWTVTAPPAPGAIGTGTGGASGPGMAAAVGPAPTTASRPTRTPPP